jgi:S-adenosylmethionine decarboxylase
MNTLTKIDYGGVAPFAANDLEQDQDHFITVDGQEVAGWHLIIDLFGAKHLDDEARIRQAFLDCVTACGATLLHIHTHVFEPNGGVSGVAVLAESHISTHTWPERDYAAFDVFMCGDAEPHKAVDILKAAFEAEGVRVTEILRGKGA